ncbi:MAG TPA: YkgJ family cysteine cluster protein [Nitrospirota bacterium]|nr:YkgJ family cysteine cluster protein [Nitrospirota bacterium]
MNTNPDSEWLTCRAGCGACCIAPSLSSNIPGMPHGKPAGVRCIQLTSNNRCAIYGRPDRPDVCRSYKTSDICGKNREEALHSLAELEIATTHQTSASASPGG